MCKLRINGIGIDTITFEMPSQTPGARGNDTTTHHIKFSNTREHQDNMSVQRIPAYTPILHSKTGVCRGIPIFLIFAPKHRLWVLVRTASPKRF